MTAPIDPAMAHCGQCAHRLGAGCGMLDCSEVAEKQRQRVAQLEGVLTEVLAHFTEHGHPGYRAVRTPWLMTGFVQQWRDVLSHSTTTTGDPS